VSEDDDRGAIDESRRAFVKRVAIGGAVLASGITVGQKPSNAEGDDNPLATTGSGRPHIRLAGYPVDRVKALMDGRVSIDGCDISFQKTGITKLNSMALGGSQDWEVQEIGLHPYMLAYANGALRDYSLIPVFPLRTFRHKSIFVRSDRGIEKPSDLRGKKVCVSGYSQSSLVWIRGILEHEYGVKPSDMQWVISSTSSEGKVSKNESMRPKGVPIEDGPPGKNESELLVEGAVDAVFSAKEPQAFIDGNPIVTRLFADSRATERAYFEKTRIFPIMHVVAIRNDAIERYPWLPQRTFEAYSQSKSLMYANMRDIGWAMVALPWFAQELDDTRKLMGDNFWTYGLTPDNRKTLDALFQYSHEQGFSQRRLTIDELFHPSTMNLIDEG
jgi:4,5-dihydroxyphthalate decarboxylase